MKFKIFDNNTKLSIIKIVVLGMYQYINTIHLRVAEK